jgi:Flp pilus assembly protein TadG
MPVTDRGSMTVEFVIVAPMFVALMLLIALAGTWFNDTSAVNAAARDAARTASNIVNWGNVQGAATQAAEQDLSGLCQGNPSVQIDQPPPEAWATAPQIEVTVTCAVPLSLFNYIGLGGSRNVSAVGYAPLDPYSYRTGGLWPGPDGIAVRCRCGW